MLFRRKIIAVSIAKKLVAELASDKWLQSSAEACVQKQKHIWKRVRMRSEEAEKSGKTADEWERLVWVDGADDDKVAEEKKIHKKTH